MVYRKTCYKLALDGFMNPHSIVTNMLEYLNNSFTSKQISCLLSLNS